MSLLGVMTFGTLFTVEQQTARTVERFGKFKRVAKAGLNTKMPFMDSLSRPVNLRVQELEVPVESKTSDDVFVTLKVAVQYFVVEDKVFEAAYKLNDPKKQMESYIFDVVRAEVPKLTLDEVFKKKDDIANAIKAELTETMDDYGYGIMKALVNDIDPDKKVKEAMNAVRAAERMREAAVQEGEGQKIRIVKAAEAERESKILQGQGIAGQRKAIAEGLREAFSTVQQAVPGTDEKDIMSMVMLVQYMDMLKDVAGTNHSNTILLPHSPGALHDLYEQIRNGVMVGTMAADGTKGETHRAHEERKGTAKTGVHE